MFRGRIFTDPTFVVGPIFQQFNLLPIFDSASDLEIVHKSSHPLRARRNQEEIRTSGKHRLVGFPLIGVSGLGTGEAGSILSVPEPGKIGFGTTRKKGLKTGANGASQCDSPRLPVLFI